GMRRYHASVVESESPERKASTGATLQDRGSSPTSVPAGMACAGISFWPLCYRFFSRDHRPPPYSTTGRGRRGDKRKRAGTCMHKRRPLTDGSDVEHISRPVAT